jgi:hypothetical protein
MTFVRRRVQSRPAERAWLVVAMNKESEKL